MKVIGIDIGTTSICGVLLDAENGKVLRSKTVNSEAFIDTPNEWEKIQDVAKIIAIASEVLDSFLESSLSLLSIFKKSVFPPVLIW